jgi:hypothetical protein
MSQKWTAIGGARRCGDGIWFSIPGIGDFAVSSEMAPKLIVEGETVPLVQISDISAPFRVGEAYWSQSGRMICLSVPGDGSRHAAVQVSGKHLCAHYLRNEKRAVPIVQPPEAPKLPPGIRLAVV